MKIKRILINHQIPGAIIDLIEESEEYCFLVTPYFEPWNLLYRALEKGANKEKKIVFIFRAENGITSEMRNLNKQYGYDVILVDRLHTKLYFNEKKVLISSMNLYDSSKENNYELGYIIKGRSRSKRFKEKVIENDILSLEPVNILKGRYYKSLEEEEDKTEGKTTEEGKRENQNTCDDLGYCIRCGNRINQNPYYPLCSECYNVWSNFSNPYYTECYCHICGKEYPTSKQQPICEECEQKM